MWVIEMWMGCGFMLLVYLRHLMVNQQIRHERHGQKRKSSEGVINEHD